MTSPSFEKPWHEHDLDHVHSEVFETVRTIKHDLTELRNGWKYYRELYADRRYSAMPTGSTEGDETAKDDTYLSWNAVSAAIDALVAKLGQRLPGVYFQAEDTPEIEQEQLRGLERWNRGMERLDEHFQADIETMYNWTITGTGIWKPYALNGTIRFQAIPPERYIVDNRAAYGGVAQGAFHIEHYDRETLLADWVDRPGVSKRDNARIKRAIENAEDSVATPHRNRAMVDVIEAIVVKRGSRKGRKVVVTTAGALLDGDYPYEDLNTARVRWKPDPMGGWYGIGAVREVAGPQRQINATLSDMREMVARNSKAYTTRDAIRRYREEGSDTFDAELASEQKWKALDGEQLQLMLPPLFPPQMVEYIEVNWEKVFEILGLSQLTATSQKPPGLRSGKALLTFHDIETGRFSQQANIITRMRPRQAFLKMRTAREMKQGDLGDPRVMAPRTKGEKKFYQMVKWSDVDPKGAELLIDAQPVSSYSATPSARRQEIADDMNQGVLDRDEARDLRDDLPDLTKQRKLARAPRDFAERACEDILSGKEVEVDALMDMRVAYSVGQQYYLRARIDEKPPERLAALQEWVEQVKHLLDEEEQKAVERQQQLNALPGDPAAAQQLAQAQASLEGQGGGQP